MDPYSNSSRRDSGGLHCGRMFEPARRWQQIICLKNVQFSKLQPNLPSVAQKNVVPKNPLASNNIHFIIQPTRLPGTVLSWESCRFDPWFTEQSIRNKHDS